MARFFQMNLLSFSLSPNQLSPRIPCAMGGEGKKEPLPGNHLRQWTVAGAAVRGAMGIILCTFLGACASGGGSFKKDRAAAQAVGGTTWSNFVIKNLSKMDSYLPYDQQAADVESAVEYASPQDKQFLVGVKARILRDQANKPQLDAQNASYQPTTASSSSYGSNSNSSPSSSYTPSSSSSSYSNPVSQNAQRQDATDFNNMINKIEYGTATRTGNPYVR